MHTRRKPNTEEKMKKTKRLGIWNRLWRRRWWW